MRAAVERWLTRFSTGRSDFRTTAAGLRSLMAADSEARIEADYTIAMALQDAIDDHKLPYGLAQALLQAVHAAGEDHAPLLADAIRRSDITDLLERFGAMCRGPSRSCAGDGTEGDRRVLRGRFVLDAEIGQGGMGVVFRAIDRRRRELDAVSPYVAIKLLNPALADNCIAVRALEAEARCTQALNHPNIVAVHDFDRDGAAVFIVMEHLVGYSVDVMLRRFPTFAGSLLARRAVTDLVAALAQAHAQGVAHADLKPANLFIRTDGRLKVLDFGIAAVAAEWPVDTTIERAVTPVYASPERLAGGPRSSRDDVYALGCLVHLLLTGQHPFGRRDALESRRLGLVPPAIDGLSLAANGEVASALAFEGARRPADASAFPNLLSCVRKR